MSAHVGQRAAIKGIQTVQGLQIIGGPLIPEIEVRESQISPGCWEPIRGFGPGIIPKKYGVVLFKRVQGGLFLPVIKLLEQHIRLSEEQGGEMLGCPGVSYQTILRLRANGFLRGSAITPRTTTISVESWIEHLVASEDPDFWTPDRRKLFARPIR